MHEPLSQRLAKIMETGSETGALTLNQMLERTAGRGIYLVMIVLCVPFITPVPLPGVSTVLGCVVIILALRLALALPPRLPRFMGERPLPEGMQKIVLGGSVRMLQWIERFARPRKTQWLGWPVARMGNSILILSMALLLTMPVPPFMLFSNSLPSLAIILTAVSMMEEDGRMIWLAYLASLVTVLWFALSAGVIVAFLGQIYGRFTQTM
jgi:hypothetical protein